MSPHCPYQCGRAQITKRVRWRSIPDSQPLSFKLQPRTTAVTLSAPGTKTDKMRVMELAAAMLLVAMATAQPHPDLYPGPSTGMAGTPMGVSTGRPAQSSKVPGSPTTTPAMATDTSSALPTQPDTTQPPVNVTTAADVTSTPDVTTAAMTTPPATTAAPDYYPSIDEIVNAFKAIAHSEYFKTLSYDDQMLVLELTSGGEVGKIAEIMDNLGYQRLFTFIYKIPLKYLDNLMQFILAGLERENLLQAANSS